MATVKPERNQLRKIGGPVKQKRASRVRHARKIQTRYCEVSEDGEVCGQEETARGLCRKHYERWRKWGDVHKVGDGGTRQSVPDELLEAGISARMRNHWAALGVIGIDQDPQSGRYLWTQDAISVALIVKRLLDAGFPLVIAGRVAQHSVRHGRERVAVAPGVHVSVERPALTAAEELL